MATIPLPQTPFPTGVTQLVNQAVSGSSVTVSLNRCTGASALQWPQATTVARVDLSVSTDGVTFVYGGGFSAQGGILLSVDGITDLGATSATWQYAQPITNLIVTLTVTSGPLATSGSVVVQ